MNNKTTSWRFFTFLAWIVFLFIIALSIVVYYRTKYKRSVYEKYKLEHKIK